METMESGTELVATLRKRGLTRRQIDACPRMDGITGLRVTEEPECPDERLARIHAAFQVAPTGAVLSGWAAAVLHGVPKDFMDGTVDGQRRRPVEFSVPRAKGISERNGIRVHCSAVEPGHITTIQGHRVTNPARTAMDLARWTKQPARRLGMIDLCLRHGLVTRGAFAAFLEPLRGFHGLRHVKHQLLLASTRAESVPESELRYHWLAAGLPPPLVNVPLFDLRGHLVGRPDLLDTESGLVGEYQGFWHLIDGRAGQDQERATRFRRMNLTVEEFWKADIGRDVVQLPARLRRAHQAGLARDRRLDAWVVADVSD